MFVKHDYQLIDFGQGRRLERFGNIVLDRPCPAVEFSAKGDISVWSKADAYFKDSGAIEGQWMYHHKLPDRWTIAHSPLLFELKRTPFGHIGLFPEQAENWDWINAWGKGLGTRSKVEEEQLKILNLFAYTGGSTLAAAAAGMEVVHVDAAKNIVDWARCNAELSGLAGTPIRWITDDAMKFVKRELKRGNRYDGIILDPPSYGHGRRGEIWRLSKNLPELLDICAELTAGRCKFVLLTCHTPGYESSILADMLIQSFPCMKRGNIVAKTLTIRSDTGRELPCGVMVRCMAGISF
jgi:23S rRNA (cytosine1962-C5)-methyltransferase